MAKLLNVVIIGNLIDRRRISVSDAEVAAGNYLELVHARYPDMRSRTAGHMVFYIVIDGTTKNPTRHSEVYDAAGRLVARETPRSGNVSQLDTFDTDTGTRVISVASRDGIFHGMMRYFSIDGKLCRTAFLDNGRELSPAECVAHRNAISALVGGLAAHKKSHQK